MENNEAREVVGEALNLEEVWVPKYFMSCNDTSCSVVIYNPQTTELETHCPYCGGLGHRIGE